MAKISNRVTTITVQTRDGNSSAQLDPAPVEVSRGVPVVFTTAHLGNRPPFVVVHFSDNLFCGNSNNSNIGTADDHGSIQQIQLKPGEKETVWVCKKAGNGTLKVFLLKKGDRPGGGGDGTYAATSPVIIVDDDDD